jgi:DNA-binding response OmpR family regulator
MTERFHSTSPSAPDPGAVGDFGDEESGVHGERRAERPRAGKRLIVVDDDRDTRSLLQYVFEREGYTVAQAPSGLRLISLLHVDRPDLILLDVMMSWINGFELCQALKQNPEFSDIPVFFISARGAPRDVARGYEVGCTDYFTKPLDLKYLVHRIQQVIGEP